MKPFIYFNESYPITAPLAYSENPGNGWDTPLYKHEDVAKTIGILMLEVNRLHVELEKK